MHDPTTGPKVSHKGLSIQRLELLLIADFLFSTLWISWRQARYSDNISTYYPLRIHSCHLPGTGDWIMEIYKHYSHRLVYRNQMAGAIVAGLAWSTGCCVGGRMRLLDVPSKGGTNVNNELNQYGGVISLSLLPQTRSQSIDTLWPYTWPVSPSRAARPLDRAGSPVHVQNNKAGGHSLHFFSLWLHLDAQCPVVCHHLSWRLQHIGQQDDCWRYRDRL